MKTLPRERTRCKSCDAGNLHEERVQWLLEYLTRRDDALGLDGAGYRFMRVMYGFSNGELDRAVAALRDRGLVRIDGLRVETIEESACSAA